MADNKIYDIVPPKGRPGLKAVILPTAHKEEISVSGGKKRFSRLPSVKKISLVVLVLLLFILGIGLYSKIVEARITIKPIQEKVEFTEDVTIQTGTDAINFDSKVIPGYITDDTQELSRQFQSSGQALQEAKAAGTIKVFNNYNLPQILVAGTRFLSSEGKLFKSQERVVIPTGRSQDIKVEAIASGEDYNIGPSSFSIPGLLGSPRYTVVYGKSSAAMAGGSVKQAAQVTVGDLDKAKTSLEQTLRDEGLKKLQAKLSQDKNTILVNGAVAQDVQDIKPTVEAGANVAYFNASGKVVSKALLLSKENLKNFVIGYISKLKSDKAINDQSIEINISFKSIDWDKQTMALVISASVKTYTKIDLDSLKREIAGKKTADVQAYIKGLPGIGSVEIKFFPIAALNVPRDQQKIKLLMVLD